MIKNHNLTSLLIPTQLPEHIRDDPAYETFVVFLQAYYEWLEEDKNVTERAKNLLNYKDVDKSTDEFLKYYYNDFLSYFPEEILEDKVEVIKLAKQLYQYKGTPASYRLLFRILYNSDVEFLDTNDVTLKASSGLWYVSKSLKLATDLINISTISTNNTTISITTRIPHYLLKGDTVVISGLAGTNPPNGSWIVNDIISLYQFTYIVNNIPSGIINHIENSVIYIPKGYVNENFLLTNNLRIFGESTKSIATIENSVISGKRLEVFISDIERLFQSGEYVRIVDNKNQDVYFTTDNKIAVRDINGNYPSGSSVLRAKILGQISQVIINPTIHGSKYQGANTRTGYIGDPVIFDGGLNTITGLGAKASIEEVTRGSISRILIDNGGYGYTEANDAEVPDPTVLANTKITITHSGGALAHVGGITTTHNTISTVNYIPRDMVPINYDNNPNNLTPPGIGAPATIVNGSNIIINWDNNHVVTGNYSILFANNFSANANTTLANAFNFMSFSTGSISSIIVDNGGGDIDYSIPPEVLAESLYKTCPGNTTISLESFTQANLKDLGILAPIQIITGGTGYSNNSIISLIGGTGRGANAKITSVDTSGAILSVEYTANGIITLGGLGYQVGDIYPTKNVANTNILNTIALEGVYKLGSGLPLVKPPVTAGSNAVMVITGILGEAALFTPIYNDVGNIVKINISEHGEDYIEPPKVSLKVKDVLIYGLASNDDSSLPKRGDTIYQGSNLISSTYKSTVDSVIRLIMNDVDPTQSIFILRVYNYTSLPDNFNLLKVDSKNITFNVNINLNQNQLDGIEQSGITNGILDGLNWDRFRNGILVYGDGAAKATATFLNGLTIGNGQYLNTTGQPSSYNILQSINYNNFTYQITVEKEISKYRKVLLDLLHPTGMKVIGRYPLKSEAKTNFNISDKLNTGNSLLHYTGNLNSNATMSVSIPSSGGVSSNVAQSTNIVKINVLGAANLNNFITSNSVVRISTDQGTGIYSEILSANTSANTITLKYNVWLTFANVAYVTANASSNVIHISSLTGQYDIINNGKYTNTVYPLMDIVRIGDNIIVANNMYKTVSSVDYVNNIIYLSANLTNNVNSSMSVNRTLTANSASVKFFTPVS